MTHTPYAPSPVRDVDAEALRARIPGWGADLDPADRPSYPKLSFREDLTGARWQVPDAQVEQVPRERSIEHAHLTPVFGTAQPTRGLAGTVRRYSYRRFSEGRAAHWVLLVVADRIDAVTAHVRSFASLRPDNPLTQTGLKGELTHHGWESRRGRVDRRHHALDPFVVAGPWLVAGVLGFVAVRALTRSVRSG